MSQDITLQTATPADVGWIVERHATLYAREEGFDDSFGPLVASILDGFMTGHDPARERGWVAWAGRRRLGCVFCVDAGQGTAKLRLFLVDPAARGQGLGHRLLETCMGFARTAGYGGMTLWTHESHKAACALYAAHGWRLTRSEPVHSFGVDLVEQSWEITF